MAGGVAQATQHLPIKHEALNSNTGTMKKTKKQKEVSSVSQFSPRSQSHSWRWSCYVSVPRVLVCTGQGTGS
jgi:hypothetical protein